MADFLDVQLLVPDVIPDMPQQDLDQLLKEDPQGWSAVSFKNGDRTLVIYNPAHSPARISNDCTHELSHLLLDHESSKLIVGDDGDFVMRSYDEKQEKEADWFAAALLLPREALLHIRSQGLQDSEGANRYGVSKKLLAYRFQVTGVDIQLARRRSSRKSI